jgi:RecB family endonuclease NucS
MTTITINSHSFIISDPYQAGVAIILSPEEAAAFNTLRAENIRNNLRKELYKAGGTPGDEALTQFNDFVAQYDRQYKFEPRGSRTASEFTILAQRLAQDRGLSPESPEIQSEARRRLTVRNSVARQSLERLFAPQEDSA